MTFLSSLTILVYLIVNRLFLLIVKFLNYIILYIFLSKIYFPKTFMLFYLVYNPQLCKCNLWSLYHHYRHYSISNFSPFLKTIFLKWIVFIKFYNPKGDLPNLDDSYMILVENMSITYKIAVHIQSFIF